jgi:hypothetical protein
LLAKMAPKSHQQILEEILETQSGRELSIIKLGEPLAAPLKNQSNDRRSDVSTDVFDNPTPASLEADLEHYKVSGQMLQT